MQNFRFDRLDELLKASSPKITRKSLCLKAHHADNYIRMFEKRGTNPPIEFIEFCATELGTTSSYLLGATDDPRPAEQKEKPTVIDDDGLSMQWADVEAAFKAATPEMREAAKAAALAVLNSQNK